MQIKSLLHSAVHQLQNFVISPHLDAEVLLADLLQLSRAQLLMCADQAVSSTDLACFERLIERRKKGEPIAYLIGKREFWSLTLEVSPHTLIPRPETELLVTTLLDKFPSNATQTIADLGTGSGAIALAIGHERPLWKVTATDKSENALAIAQRNAKRLHINNTTFVQSNWCAALSMTSYDAIVSNPPYIHPDHPCLQTDGVRYEPLQALVSAENGLSDLTLIIQQARDYLQPNGWLMLEHGYDQAKKVKELLLTQGYKEIISYADLAGVERVTVGQNCGSR